MTVTQIWLRAEGVSKKKAQQFRDFSVEAVQHEWNAEIPARGGTSEAERQRRIGGLLDRWEVRPPRLPAPAAPATGPACTPDEAGRRARAVAPADADADEIASIALDIEAGLSDAQALDAFEARRWRAAHLPQARPAW